MDFSRLDKLKFKPRLKKHWYCHYCGSRVSPNFPSYGHSCLENIQGQRQCPRPTTNIT